MTGTEPTRHDVLFVDDEPDITRSLRASLRKAPFRVLTCNSPEEALDLLAEQIASRSPNAVRAAKALFSGAPALDRKSALQLESDLQTKLMQGPNYFEAVMAVFQKRAPVFQDPPVGG